MKIRPKVAFRHAAVKPGDGLQRVNASLKSYN